MDVIDLFSDDEDAAKKKNRKPKSCINFNCNSGLEMEPAPFFACKYYGVKLEKKKKWMICSKCFETAVQHQEQLVQALLDNKPILDCDFPDHSMQVQISDSDSSGDEELVDESKEDGYLSEGTLMDLEIKLHMAVDSVENKCNLEYQLENIGTKLKSQFDTIDEENEKLDNELKSMITQLDLIRNSFYDNFKPDIKYLPEISIGKTRAAKHSRNSPAVKRVTQIRRSPAVPQQVRKQDSQLEILEEVDLDKIPITLDLPPQGTLVKPVPEVNSIVFVMKHPLIPWVKAKVHAILNRNPLNCKVKLLPKKYNNAMRNANGKHLAVMTNCPTIIPVATRVVAIFQDSYSTNYYSGVIAEPPKSTNNFRYLVFFDDGYAQYVTHMYIFVVCESSVRVWEDIPKESQDFIKKYMESYPERPMVKLSKGQILKTEWNGKWWIARVSDVDASLVQMHFDADSRTEWIYRGSARLRPLYIELMKANARQQGHHSVNTGNRLRPLTNKTNLPYVEYTSLAPETEESSTKSLPKPAPAQQPSRAVARKSTAKVVKPPALPDKSYSTTTEIKPSHSIVYYQTHNKIQTKKFKPHKCGQKCLEGISFTPDDMKGYSPLSIPLLCGWNRQVCKYSKIKKVILYQTPCGVRLRNMDELHKYLRVTGSPMSVDLFDFDHWVHCLAEFVLDKCFVNIRDLSYGMENVPIPCVNELDHTQPDTITYTIKREPTEGVNINTDSEFLCCCDCKDDCQDKEKCACWQLTMKGATLGGRIPDTAVGYIYKRLPEPVATGIYECNSRCKCNVKTCLNRVVQHPLMLKLQIFKSASRGWGIRCLNDIPHGSFICIYAGKLLTEQMSNEGGKNYGDEYLAALDYIEVVEGFKQDYESDALEPDEWMNEEPEKKSPSNPSEDEETINANVNDSDEDFLVNEYRTGIKVDYSRKLRTRIQKRRKESKSIEEDNSLPNIDENSNSSSSLGVKSMSLKLTNDMEQMIISDDDETRREPSRFDPTVEPEVDVPAFNSVRDFFGKDEAIYTMDAKTTGNIGRYLNHSCDPNVFVQNVFVDTHDVRFPWVAFFALNYIRAGQELTWNYNYDVGSVPGKVIICKCGASNCRGRLL